MRQAKSGHSMASKKKPKPQFDVPADVDEAPKAGWVYRSAAAAIEEVPAEPHKIKTAPGKAKARRDSDTYLVMSAGAEAMGHSFAAVGKLVLLGTRVIVLPVRVAERLILGR